MDALNIKHLSRLYHLTPSQCDLEHYLDATLNDVISEHLESALADITVSSDEEVCVRLLHIPLSFNMGKSQSETSQHWSEIIAIHIKMILEKGGANVIRYPSRFNALIDFAIEVSKQRLQRAWAWNQLGLARLGEKASLAQALDQLMIAFGREPNAIIPVLIRLAEEKQLIPLLQVLPPTDLSLLINTAFSYANVNFKWLKDISYYTDGLAAKSNSDIESIIDDSALMSSQLARYVISNRHQPIEVQRLTLRQWTILVLLELEPILFIRPEAVIAREINIIEYQLSLSLANSYGDVNDDKYDESGATVEQTLFDEPLLANRAKDNKRIISSLPSGQNNSGLSVINKNDETLDNNILHASSHEKIFNEDNKTATSKNNNFIEKQPINASLDSSGHGTKNPLTTDTDEPVSNNEPQDIDSEFCPELISEWGGLVYLMRLLDQSIDDKKTRFVDQLVNDMVFASRSLSWILYQLIMYGIRHQEKNSHEKDSDKPCIADADPMLRIFCNLPLEGDLPWSYENNYTQNEADALRQYASTLLNAIKNHLNWSELSLADVFQKITQHRASIRIDCGWIEVKFAIKDLATDIRRSGLDLDPDYVPWLGKVVKIRYE